MPLMLERMRRKVIRSSKTYLNFFPIDLPRVSSETNFNSILKLFRAGKKKQKEEPVLPTPAAKDFSTKRATSSTYGQKPYHKGETSAASETSQTPSETSQTPGRVLKALNKVVQEPVVHLNRSDMPLPSGTITIAPTGGGK